MSSSAQRGKSAKDRLSQGPRPRPRQPGPSDRRRLSVYRRGARNRRWVLAGTVAVLFVGISVVAIARTSSRSAEPTASVAPLRPAGTYTGPGAASAGVGVGQVAPPFTVKTLSGSTFSQPAGKPAIILWMAGWCSSCIAPAQALDRIERAYGERVAVLAVSADPTDSAQALRGFMEVVGDPRYGFALDPDSSIVTAYGIQSLDTVLVTDAQGKVMFRGLSPRESDLRSALAAAGLS